MSKKHRRLRVVSLNRMEIPLQVQRDTILNADATYLENVSSLIDKNLLLHAARTQRCAGEGELVFGLTEHARSLSGGDAGRQRLVLAAWEGPLGGFGEA